MQNFYNTEIAEPNAEEENASYQRWKKIRTAKYVLSATLALTGLAILGSQLGPLAVSYMEGMLLEAQTESIKDPTTEQELYQSDADLPYFDPGVSYFQNLIQHIGGQAVAGVSTGIYPDRQDDVFVDDTYSKPMFITIPSIGISDITVTPNVDSFDESTYNESLKSGTAHFKGTPLPGDGGNSFIYGHSAVESYFSNHEDDPETIFSRLENVEISDTITIQKDGKIFTYVVQKKKIAEPDDFEVITGNSRKETVTLMTCWPLGIGSKRLIVIGELIDG